MTAVLLRLAFSSFKDPLAPTLQLQDSQSENPPGVPSDLLTLTLFPRSYLSQACDKSCS